MLTKIKQEIVQLFSVKKAVLLMAGTILCIDVNLRIYVRDYGGASLCEFIIYFLTNMYNILMLVTISVLAVSNDKYGVQNRYVLLLRHRNRSEYYLINICARMLYAIGCVIIMLVLLLLYGKYRGLSGRETVMFVQVSVGTVIKQCMNVVSYAIMVIVLYSLFNTILKNKVADVLLMMGVPLINLMAVKTGLYWLARWLPWQSIAFQLYGWESNHYRVNWEYWIILIGIFLYAGDRFFVNKDIVYENN